MSKNQILIAFISSMLLTVAMIGGAWLYYQQDNTFFGLIDLEKTKAHYYDIDPEKEFVISGNELIELKSNTDRMYELEKKYNSIKKKYDNVKSEFSRLKSESSKSGQKMDSLSSQLTKLAKKEQLLKDSLNVIDTQLKSLKKNYATIQDDLKELLLSGEEEEDSLRTRNYKDFAKIYNNSNPEEVAKILEKLEAFESAQILKLMSKKKAGKVIESLKSEYAAKVLIQSGELK